MGLIPVVISPGGRVGEDTIPTVIVCQFPSPDVPGTAPETGVPQRTSTWDRAWQGTAGKQAEKWKI